MKSRYSAIVLAVCLVCALPPRVAGAQAHLSKTKSNSSGNAIPQAAQLAPSELMQQLSISPKPLVLQVGSHVLYAQAHIPASEYVGAAGSPAGAQALRDRVKNLPKDQLLVIYCGCCPWDRCPNIGAAYQQLQSLGFTHVKALYLANNFGDDWVNKGYPVEKGR